MLVQDKKLERVATYAQSRGIPVLSAGDNFNTYLCGHDVVNSTMDILRRVAFFSCYGQHELPDHDIKQMYRSPLTTLLLASPAPVFTSHGKNIRVDTCSWGEHVKKDACLPNDGKVIHVLLLHKTVYLGDKPFPKATGDVTKLIKQPEYAQYDVIISGDNHKAFTYRKGKTLWVNCGCLYRKTATERDYVPSFWVFFWNTELKKIVVKQMPVPYVRKHVSREHLEEKEEEAEWDSRFAKRVAKIKNLRPTSFREDLKVALISCDEAVQKKAWHYTEF